MTAFLRRAPGRPAERPCAADRLRAGAPTPPFFRSFGIKDLGGGSRQVFRFKGLAGKVYRTNELTCQRALKMGLGQFRGPSWLTDNASKLRSDLYRGAQRRLVNGFRSVDCDEEIDEVSAPLTNRILMTDTARAGTSRAVRTAREEPRPST